MSNFKITNVGGNTFRGAVGESRAECNIDSGRGPNALTVGQSIQVPVRVSPHHGGL